MTGIHIKYFLHKLWRRLRHALTMAVFLTSVSACSDNPFPITESGIESKHWIARPIWLDNERVLIYVSAEGLYRGESLNKEGLYIWTVGKGIEWLDKAVGRSCYDGGRIYYMVKVDYSEKHPVYTYKYGQFNKLDEITIRRQDGIGFNEHDCSLMKIYDLPSRDRHYARLRPEHGFLDMGRAKVSEGKDLVALVKPDGTRIPLNIKHSDAIFIQYLHFKNAYYLNWSERDGHWVTPEGQVTTVPVPPEGPWQGGGSVLQQPTKAGLFVIAHGLNRDGIYFIQGNAYKKIISKMVQEPSVSPDGCHLAFLHEGKHGMAVRHYVLKSMNVCEGFVV